MTVQMSAAVFRKAIATSAKVIERRGTIPILSTVRCRANGRFEAEATDIDISLKVAVPRGPGAHADLSLMAPKHVVSAIAAGGGDSIVLDHADGKATIVSGALNLSVATLPGDDFPTYFERPITPRFSATLSDGHIAALARVADAMSGEETRYYLNGLHLRFVGASTLRAEATDGHRLYYVDIEAPDAQGALPSNTIIPRKAVRLLLDLAKATSAGVRLTIGPTPPANSVEGTAPERAGADRASLSFEVGEQAISIATKLIDGNFPDVSRAIPDGGGKQMLFKTPELRRALSAISGHQRHVRATRIELAAPGIAKISAAYVDLRLSVEATVACEHASTGFVVGFNGGYLASVLAASGGEEVLFDAADASAPALIRNPADTAWTAVLMPMRV